MSTPQLDGLVGRPIEDALAAVGSSSAGLEDAEASRRLRSVGRNQLEDAGYGHPLAILGAQFRSPLVLILVVAAALTFAIGEQAEASTIAVIVLASSGLAFYQEYRASNAMRILRRRLATQARVRRSGSVVSVPVSEVVPGDILLLTAGSLVPADGVVLDGADLQVDEASLTGESFPVEKRTSGAGVVSEDMLVRMGTSVRSGAASAIVIDTGKRTQFGRLGHALTSTEPETSFTQGVRRFGVLMTQIMLVMLALIVPVNVLLGRPLVDTLLFSAALAVGLTPELLPAIVTVTLSRGAQSLARTGVLVRRLVAIENLGAMDVLCTDKTGTLTEGKVRLQLACNLHGNQSGEVLRLANLNAALQTALPNPLDVAIVTAAGEAGTLATKLDEVPYDFERRRLSVLVGAEDGNLLVCKGAVASILAVCRFSALDGKTAELDPLALQVEDARVAAWGEQGFRVLALATRNMGRAENCTRDDEREMNLTGYLLFSDDLKPGVTATVSDLDRKGIRLKIVTGDSRHVAMAVAAGVGVGKRVLVGDEIARLGTRGLIHKVGRTDIFAEVTPDQKERVVAALRRTGKVVGYLGDGINDAPALRAADVGISVDSAVDAAREAADVVLLQRDLGVLLNGILVGRTAFANTVKYITITTSANLGNMVSMALASLFLPFLPMLAKQILLNNSLSDVPMLAISTDNVDANVLRRPGIWDFRQLLRSMFAFGLLSSLFDGLTFAGLLLLLRATEADFQTAWFLMSLVTELAIVAVMRTQDWFYKSVPGRFMLVASGSVAAIALLLPFTPLSGALGFEAPSILTFCFLAAVVSGYVIASELLKHWLGRRLRARRRHRAGRVSAAPRQ